LLDWSDFVAALGELLKGPFGGLIGGAVSFVLLELFARRWRAQRDLAEAIAAELADNADNIDAILQEADRSEIPRYHKTSDTVYSSLTGRLGELRYQDVFQVVRLYRYLESCNRMPLTWHERVVALARLPSNDPRVVEAGKEVAESPPAFYSLLDGLRTDCHSLAVHLRTRYGLGVRRLLPMRLRPTAKLGRELEPPRS
jgi:hypothetical protein